MKREGWIDSCRFFAIFVIMATHFLADLLPGALALWEEMPTRLLLGGLTGKFSVAFFFVLLGYFACSPKRFTLRDFGSYAFRRYLQFAFFVLITEAVYLVGCRGVFALFRAPDEAARLVLSDGWRYNFVYLLRDSFLFEDHYDATLWCLQQLFLSSLVCRLLGCLPERLSPLTRAGIAVGIGVLLLLLSPAYCVWISVSLLGCLLRLALSEVDRLPALTKPPVLIGLFAAAVLCIKAPLEEGLPLYLLEGLGAFLLLWVLFRTAWARRLLGRGPFPRLGLWSMGLFVVHTPVFSLVDSSLYVLLDGRLPLWAALPVTFAVGLTLCVLASRLLHAAYGALSRRFGRERVNA